VQVWQTAQSVETAQLFARHSPGAFDLLQVMPVGQAFGASQ
jgi:hypothetical protein